MWLSKALAKEEDEMSSSQNASGPVVKEHLYKVLVIGEFGVGKRLDEFCWDRCWFYLSVFSRKGMNFTVG